MQMQALYYKDCHIRQFESRVTDCRPSEDGYDVILEQTAFYPEGGGQLCDTGTLDGVPVTAVFERDEKVVHRCRQPLPIGQTVTGTIDWERRFDQMQQHTGEHILSGLIHDRFGFHNSGFHVGAQVMEVDFDGVIPAEALPELEAQANRLIWENRPVKGYIPAPEALEKISYRSKRPLAYPVRIVEIPGVDTCACCGVHVAATGEVGLLKILSCVKFHEGVRLELVCGGRAYDYLRQIFEQNRAVSQLLSARLPETAAAVQKLSAAYAEEKFRNTALKKQIFSLTAARYRGIGNVLHREDGLTGGEQRELAEAISGESGANAVVITAAPDGNTRLCLYSTHDDAGTIGRLCMEKLHGRGGGKGPAFSGTVSATAEEIAGFFPEYERNFP